MSSSDDRQRSVTNGLQLPGLASQLSATEQVPFPKNTPLPGRRTRYLEYDSSPSISDSLTETESSPDATGSLPEYTATPPRVTRVLPDIHTGKLPSPSTRSTTTALRQPVVIRGTNTKSPRTIRPPKGRKGVISIAVICLLFLITLGTAFAVSPLGNVTGHGINLIPFVSNLVHNNNSNLSLVAQQATATAVIRQDGYDPTSSGAATLMGGGGLNRFAFGQCTYWANYRYHQLTGYWVDWLGNAYQWAAGARAAGWIVSPTPNLKGPSIIVLQPYVEGASYFGHVAVVERVNKDGSVWASNFNWYANGGWDTLSYWTFTPGPGVSFVWHP